MNAEQPPDRLRNPTFRPNPQQVRTGFEQMQVRVHAEVGVGILLAQAHILQRPPVPGQSFGISAPRRIPDMFFKRPEQRSRFIQRRRVTRCPDIFAQPVNRKADGIALFLAAERISAGGNLPIDASVHRVDQPRDQQFADLAGRIQVFRPSGHAVSGRKGPQHPRDQNSTFSGFGVCFPATVDPPRKMLSVTQKRRPERQDAAGQLLRQFVAPLYKHLFHHSFVFRRRASSVVIRSIRFSPSG